MLEQASNIIIGITGEKVGNAPNSPANNAAEKWSKLNQECSACQSHYLNFSHVTHARVNQSNKLK